MTSTVIWLFLRSSSCFCRSRASWVSGETMAMWEAGLLRAAPMALTRPPPIMISGIRTVITTKERVRMRSRYSRFAMSQTLCIGFASYGFDEDLFEGWLHDLEARDAGAAGDGLGQQRLRVGMGTVAVAGVELDLGVAGVVLVALDRGVVE